MSGQSGIFNAIDSVTEVPYVEVGTQRVKDGAKYVYLQLASTSGTVAAGSLVYYLTGLTTVTDDVANSKANLVAGVAIASVAAGYYAWFLTFGTGVTVNTNGDDDISAGDTLIAGTTGTVNSIAAGSAFTYKVVGFAEEDDVDAANTVLATIDIR